MPKRAIFLDIDGCVLAENGYVSENYYQALFKISEWIRRECQDGPVIRICSNRDPNSAEIIAGLLGIVNSWIIIEKGVAIFNPTTKEMIFNPALTPAKRKSLKNFSQKIMPQILSEYPSLYLYPGTLMGIAIEKKPESPLDIKRIYLKIRQKLARYLRKRLLRIFLSGRVIIIMPSGVSKGTGTEFLARKEGLDLSQSLAIGDSQSDISMFRRTKFIGCPSNSDQTCKDFVRSRRGRISPKSYAEGVIDIIEYYFGSQ